MLFVSARYRWKISACASSRYQAHFPDEVRPESRLLQAMKFIHTKIIIFQLNEFFYPTIITCDTVLTFHWVKNHVTYIGYAFHWLWPEHTEMLQESPDLILALLDFAPELGLALRL